MSTRTTPAKRAHATPSNAYAIATAVKHDKALRRGKLVHALSPTYSIARAHTISPAGQAHKQAVAEAGPYTAPELRTWLRPGADDHERYPSRMGNVRLWRDGRREVAA